MFKTPFELKINSNYEEQMQIKSHIVPVTMVPVSVVKIYILINSK